MKEDLLNCLIEAYGFNLVQLNLCFLKFQFKPGVHLKTLLVRDFVHFPFEN